jgi:hypothetical protein
MNNNFLPTIEEAIKWFTTPQQEDPRAALRTARIQELTKRGQPLPTKAAELNYLASQYLHEIAQEPELIADAGRQYWAAPYDNDYLVIIFPPDFAFKALDLVALSSKEDLSFDQLKSAAESGNQQVVLEMASPLALQGKPWLTSVTVSQAKAGDTLYLHYFFVAKAQPDEGGIAQKANRQKILDASSELAQIENPNNVDGVAHLPHPSIAPHQILVENDTSMKLEAANAVVSVGTTESAFERLFLTLAGPVNDGSAPWRAYVVLNLELASGQVPQGDDYLALADHYPTGGSDYLARQWQWISYLDESLSYETDTTCNQSISYNFTVADLNELEKMYIFYGRKSNGNWVIVGEPATYRQQKRWMEESLPDIGQKKLHEIIIPGTHDAGTFDVEAKGTWAAMNAQTQNLNFPGQLALGIRYFDCRLENWPDSHPDQPFWFCHGLAWTWTEITDLISALETFFTTDNSKDIVILDFCRFQNFGPSDYTKFFNLFTNHSVLGPAIISPDEASQLTINSLFARGKRLFILCEDTTARTNFNLGESINLDGENPDTDSINTLKGKLDKWITAHAGGGKLWALQAILNPGFPYPVFPEADKLSRVLRKWVAGDWWDKANVIFCDFAAGADLLHATKECNKRRYNPQNGKLYWYEHSDWQTGRPFPSSPSVGQEIGFGGWMTFKSVTGSSEGWIYAINWNGGLLRYHDTHWQTGNAPMNTSPDTISSDNWTQYRQVFASNNASGNRLIYAITGNYLSWGTGKLWRFEDTGSDTLGQGTLIDAGWENFRFAFASSDGVIYAVNSSGGLSRYHDAGGDKIQQGTQISTGWEKYIAAFATSAGVIYAIDGQGNVWWWQDTGSNQLGDGKNIGSGWSDFRMIFATSEGRFYVIEE